MTLEQLVEIVLKMRMHKQKDIQIGGGWDGVLTDDQKTYALVDVLMHLHLYWKLEPFRSRYMHFFPEFEYDHLLENMKQYNGNKVFLHSNSSTYNIAAVGTILSVEECMDKNILSPDGKKFIKSKDLSGSKFTYYKLHRQPRLLVRIESIEAPGLRLKYPAKKGKLHWQTVRKVTLSCGMPLIPLLTLRKSQVQLLILITTTTTPPLH